MTNTTDTTIYVYFYAAFFLLFCILFYIIAKCWYTQQKNLRRRIGYNAEGQEQSQIIVQDYQKSKIQTEKTLSDGMSLFLYFKAIYPDYKLIFPTIMRLVFPLPEEEIFETINFVAQNVYKDSDGINTINLSKIAQFQSQLRTRLEARYLNGQVNYSQHNQNSSGSSEEDAASIELDASQDQTQTQINSEISPRRIRRNGTRVTMESEKKSYFLNLSRLESKISNLDKDYDMRAKLSISRQEISEKIQNSQYKFLSNGNNGMIRNPLPEPELFKKMINQIDPESLKLLGSQELKNFLKDFENFVLYNQQYRKQSNDCIEELAEADPEKLIKLLQNKAQVLLIFMKNMFQFSFDTVITKGYAKLVDNYEMRVNEAKSSASKMQYSSPLKQNLSQFSIKAKQTMQPSSDASLNDFYNPRDSDIVQQLTIEHPGQKKPTINVTSLESISPKSKKYPSFLDKLEPIEESSEDNDFEDEQQNENGYQALNKEPNGDFNDLENQIVLDSAYKLSFMPNDCGLNLLQEKMQNLSEIKPKDSLFAFDKRGVSCPNLQFQVPTNGNKNKRLTKFTKEYHELLDAVEEEQRMKQAKNFFKQQRSQEEVKVPQNQNAEQLRSFQYTKQEPQILYEESEDDNSEDSRSSYGQDTDMIKPRSQQNVQSTSKDSESYFNTPIRNPQSHKSTLILSNESTKDQNNLQYMSTHMICDQSPDRSLAAIKQLNLDTESSYYYDEESKSDNHNFQQQIHFKETFDPFSKNNDSSNMMNYGDDEIKAQGGTALLNMDDKNQINPFQQSKIKERDLVSPSIMQLNFTPRKKAMKGFIFETPEKDKLNQIQSDSHDEQAQFQTNETKLRRPANQQYQNLSNNNVISPKHFDDCSLSQNKPQILQQSEYDTPVKANKYTANHELTSSQDGLQSKKIDPSNDHKIQKRISARKQLAKHLQFVSLEDQSKRELDLMQDQDVSQDTQNTNIIVDEKQKALNQLQITSNKMKSRKQKKGKKQQKSKMNNQNILDKTQDNVQQRSQEDLNCADVESKPQIQGNGNADTNEQTDSKVSLIKLKKSFNTSSSENNRYSESINAESLQQVPSINTTAHNIEEEKQNEQVITSQQKDDVSKVPQKIIKQNQIQANGMYTNRKHNTFSPTDQHSTFQLLDTNQRQLYAQEIPIQQQLPNVGKQQKEEIKTQANINCKEEIKDASHENLKNLQFNTLNEVENDILGQTISYHNANQFYPITQQLNHLLKTNQTPQTIQGNLQTAQQQMELLPMTSKGAHIQAQPPKQISDMMNFSNISRSNPQTTPSLNNDLIKGKKGQHPKKNYDYDHSIQESSRIAQQHEKGNNQQIEESLNFSNQPLLSEYLSAQSNPLGQVQPIQTNQDLNAQSQANNEDQQQNKDANEFKDSNQVLEVSETNKQNTKKPKKKKGTAHQSYKSKRLLRKQQASQPVMHDSGFQDQSIKSENHSSSQEDTSPLNPQIFNQDTKVDFINTNQNLAKHNEVANYSQQLKSQQEEGGKGNQKYQIDKLEHNPSSKLKEQDILPQIVQSSINNQQDENQNSHFVIEVNQEVEAYRPNSEIQDQIKDQSTQPQPQKLQVQSQHLNTNPQGLQKQSYSDYYRKSEVDPIAYNFSPKYKLNQQVAQQKGFKKMNFNWDTVPQTEHQNDVSLHEQDALKQEQTVKANVKQGTNRSPIQKKNLPQIQVDDPIDNYEDPIAYNIQGQDSNKQILSDKDLSLNTVNKNTSQNYEGYQKHLNSQNFQYEEQKSEFNKVVYNQGFFNQNMQSQQQDERVNQQKQDGQNLQTQSPRKTGQATEYEVSNSDVESIYSARKATLNHQDTIEKQYEALVSYDGNSKQASRSSNKNSQQIKPVAFIQQANDDNILLQGDLRQLSNKIKPEDHKVVSSSDKNKQSLLKPRISQKRASNAQSEENETGYQDTIYWEDDPAQPAYYSFDNY